MKFFQKQKFKWIAGLIISLLVTLVILLFYIFDLLQRVEYNAYDLRFRLRGTVESEAPVRIIAIDDKSLQIFGRWPWRRELHAYLINILLKYKVKAVMFDILFIEPDRNYPEDDIKLMKMTRKARNVYYPFYFMDEENPSLPPKHFLKFGKRLDKTEDFLSVNKVFLPLPGLLDNLKGTGYANGSPDEDGTTRKALLLIQYSERIYPLISFQMACDYFNADFHNIKVIPGKYIELKSEQDKDKIIRIPIDESCQMAINYFGGLETLKGYSFADIVHAYKQVQRGEKPDISLEDLKDKVIFVGLTAAGTVDDLSPTPFTSAYPMVGAHASIFENLISKNFLRDAPMFLEIILLILLGSLMGLVIPRLRPVNGILFTFFLLVIYLIFNFFFFVQMGINFKIVYPLLVIVLSDLFVVIYKYATEEKEKKWIKNVFSTYITPSVVNKILKEPDLLKLGGERREMTVYFSDIAGFTTISEALSPEALVSLINEYLSTMTNIIFKYEGTLDKYEGDAIMAFWNAPTDQPDHALKCCKAALECFKELDNLHKKWKKEGKPLLNMRIGINTGAMIVGNMGSNVRMDYTVMGDSVNLGARLEAANKVYGTRLMISEFTREKVKDEIECRELDALKVKGKTMPVYVYEVIALKGELPQNKKRVVKLYNQGLECYKNQDWNNSIKLFQEALYIIADDGPSKTYLHRCQEYKKNPPPPDWDGVWELKTK